MIEPLYQGRSAHEVVALLTDLKESSGREIVRAHWRRQWELRREGGNFEQYWQKALHDGVVPDTAFKPKSVKLQDGCVQRIRRAKIDSETEVRRLVDGEVLTACQAACPVQAIVFGDMNDPKSKVKQAKDSPLHYALLGDLNTNPRTTYLAALRNPNPEIEA